ncbi:CYTH domain-containing protein [Patescibacteria group bacterium]
MIEVERKFEITDPHPAFLKKANFLREIKMEDTYYDDARYSLTTKNIWVRKRNGQFEIKKPIAHNLIDRYDELVDEDTVRAYLDLDPELTIEEGLTAKEYMPFVTYHTVRQKYNMQGFKIDIDHVDFGEWNYYVGEIELNVKTEEEIEDAVTRIMNFAAENGLTIAKVPGKLVRYLYEKDPAQYQALVDSGVIQDNYLEFETRKRD